VISGALLGFFEVEQASSLFDSSLFNRWATLFVLGFLGTIFLTVATWKRRRDLRSRESDLHSIMRTNALEMAALIVMSIGILDSLSLNNSHTFGAQVPILNNPIAGFSSAGVSAGLMIAGVLVIARSSAV